MWLAYFVKNYKRNKTKLIPIDSEHFSINQLTKNYKDIDIKKIYITASWWSFFKRRPISSFNKIKPADAQTSKPGIWEKNLNRFIKSYE